MNPLLIRHSAALSGLIAALLGASALPFIATREERRRVVPAAPPSKAVATPKPIDPKYLNSAARRRLANAGDPE